jgi:uncharacterized protein (TIGR02145 family)
MLKNYALLFLILLSSLSFSQLYTPGAGVTDIDGNSYQTVIYQNGQEWMAENLKTTTYTNGSPIPNILNNPQFQSAPSGTWAHYNNDSQFENPYGKLYNAFAVADPRNVCPLGWHIPTFTEWQLLETYLDMAFTNPDLGAGLRMKESGTQHWLAPNTSADNSSGFTGLPGGILSGGGNFINMSQRGYWWSSSMFDQHSFRYNFLSYDSGSLNYDDAMWDNNAFISIRCLKNNFSSSLNELIPSTKKLNKIVDIMGNETNEKPNELLFYIYNDGTVEKKIILDK